MSRPAVFSIETLTERDIAKTIDHSLLRPELDDAFVEDGCRLAAKYDVASVCVRPADVRRATAILDGTDVAVGTTIGFPHGNHLTETKVFEAQRALADGATELDMVIQIGALGPGRDADVEADIKADRRRRPRGRRDRQGDLRERLPDRRREDPGLPPDRGRGRRLRQDQHRASRRPGATHDDLRLMRANTSPARPGEGRRRRAHARRAAST